MSITSAIVLLVCISSFAYSADNVIVVNRRLFVNNAEFIVKGQDYSPSPIGMKGMANTGYGGTGFCSAKLTPWSEWKSACYDSDYYDGSPDADPKRFPTGFKPIWQRDFPQIKLTGANTLRLYNANPSTLAATKVYTNLFTSPTGKDHTQFMDLAWQYGFRVIFPLFVDNWSYANYDEKTFKRYLRWQMDEVGNHPALLLWQFGNEQDWMWQNNANTWNSTVWLNKFNRYADYIRRYTKSKWNRDIPVTAAIANVQGVYNFQYTNWHVDIFSANVFGTDFGNLFAGSGSFYGVSALSCRTNKPFLITECGPTYKTGQVYNAGAFNQIWSNVAANINNGLLGAVYFEHTDEPALGKDFGMFGLQVAKLSDGTNSSSPNVFVPDNLTPKQQFYDVCNGTYNGGQYNMNANMYNLIQRSPYTSSNVPDTCGSTYKACPGNGYPKCSGNGICDRTTGTCSCADGWGGNDCSIASCPGSGCSGRGVCSKLVSPPECYCNPGYYGAACQSTVASVPQGQCPGGCTVGNGVCNTTSGVCACWPGWTGPDCAVTDLGVGFNATAAEGLQPYYSGCIKLTRSSNLKTGPTSSSMTNEKCRLWCSMRNYDYAVTRGTSCGCLLQASEAAAVVYSDSTCNTVCGGDSSQRCGSSSYFTSYIAGNTYRTGYIGCYIDNNNRDLPNLLINGGNTLTVESCRQACANSGYTYAGLQAGSQCWCGNTYGTQGGLSAADTDCNSACSGDSSEDCGAGWRNSIYSARLASGYAYF